MIFVTQNHNYTRLLLNPLIVLRIQYTPYVLAVGQNFPESKCVEKSAQAVQIKNLTHARAKATRHRVTCTQKNEGGVNKFNHRVCLDLSGWTFYSVCYFREARLDISGWTFCSVGYYNNRKRLWREVFVRYFPVFFFFFKCFHSRRTPKNKQRLTRMRKGATGSPVPKATRAGLEFNHQDYGRLNGSSKLP